MIGLGAKFLVTSIVGAGSVVGWASFSTPNWDPPHLWRIKSGGKFYLSLCSQRPRDREDRADSGQEWVYSDLWIYLTVKNSGEITENTQLELWGEGYYTRMQGLKVTIPEQYGKENLQEALAGAGLDDSKFDLTIENGNNRLGEISGGTNSQSFGDMIKCKKNIFATSKSSESSGIESIKLKNVQFSLGDCRNDRDNYKGVKSCSINIKETGSSQQGLKWKEFNPIVII